MRYQIAAIAVLTGLVVSGCSKEETISKEDLIGYERCVDEYLKSGKYSYLKPEYELFVIEGSCKTFVGK